MAEENLSPEEYKKLEETAIKLAQEEMAAIIAKKGKEKDMSAEDVNKAVEQYLTRINQSSAGSHARNIKAQTDSPYCQFNRC